MSQVTFDIIGGAGGKKTKDGWEEITRRCIVSELSTSTPASIIYDAVHALLESDDGIDIGDSHPSVSSLKVEEITPSAVDNANNIVTLDVVYRKPETSGTTILYPPNSTERYFHVSTKLKTVRSNIDSSGNLIELEYTDDDGQKFETIGEYEVQIPFMTLEVRERRTSSPASLAQSLTGKVNAATWQSKAAKTWLCEGIDSYTDGDYWFTTYNFTYNSDTWKTTVALVHPDLGYPPKGLTSGTGYKEIDLYATADFSTLGF